MGGEEGSEPGSYSFTKAKMDELVLSTPQIIVSFRSAYPSSTDRILNRVGYGPLAPPRGLQAEQPPVAPIKNSLQLDVEALSTAHLPR